MRAGKAQSTLVAAAIGVLLLGYLALLWSLRFPNLSADSLDYASTARNLAEGAGFKLELIAFHPGKLSTVSHLPEWHGLLRPFELAPIFWLFGAKDSLVVVPDIFYAGGTVLLAYALGRRLSGHVAGFLAAVLLINRPDLSFYALCTTDDVGSAFWVLLTLFFAARTPGASATRWAAAVGLAAGFGTLEKFTGLLLPIAIVAVLLLSRAARDTLRARHLPLILGPSAFVVGLYFLRNYLVYGAYDFRFSALEWLSKENPAAYFYYYPVRPTVSGVWSQLGIHGVLHGIGIELGALLRATVGAWWYSFGGLFALGFLGRKAPRFGVASLFFGGLLIGSICIGHQFEPRYLLSFVCVEGVALAIVVADAAQALVARLPSRWTTVANGALVAVGVFLFVVLPARALLGSRDAVRALRASPCCPGLADDVQRRVAPEEALLTVNPWLVVWRLRRPAVMVPSNGPDAIVEVARNYGAHWALVGVEPGWPMMPPGYFEEQLRLLMNRGTGLRPREVAASEDCRLYDLR